MADSTSSSSASCHWLLRSILAGEPVAWRELAATAAAGPLTGLFAEGLDGPRLTKASAELRRHCVALPTAAESTIWSAVSVLRLTALDHQDAAWDDLMPRWLVPSLPPEVRGLGLLALALNLRDRINADDYAAMMDEALHLLPADSPLRHAYTYQYALYLGLRGMLQRIADLVALPRPGDQEPEVAPSLLAECFYDAVCCGRTAQAVFLDRLLSQTPDASWQSGLIDLHRVHLPVFAAIADQTSLPEQAQVPSLPMIRALLANEADRYDEFVPAEGGEEEISPLLAYDHLRIALARRDISAARAMLDRRTSGASRHWLDDLFLARLLLLEGHLEEAGRAFSRVEASAQRYGAIERLEIELRLASELSRHDLCRLGLAAVPGGRVAAVTPDPGPDAPLIAGSSTGACTLRQRLDRIATSAARLVLLCGSDDGSRLSVARLLHARTGGGPCTILSATSGSWHDHAASALLRPGTVILDDLQGLDVAGQAGLLTLLAQTPQARCLCMASPQLGPMLAEGRFRQDLFWQIANEVIHLPAFSARAGDRQAIAAACGGPDASLRWESGAAAALADLAFAGGWAQFRVFARHLHPRCHHGIVSREAVLASFAAVSACEPRTT